MACLLKIPTETSKGVVTFTTQERDNFINTDKKIEEKIQQLKKNWVVGLHHNWHDFKFHYNPLFDFSMAGEEDLREVDSVPVPLVPMDACNFIPDSFIEKSNGEKFWDILYVARAVRFKKIPEFFDCVRKMYDAGKKYKILFICPMPPYKRSDRRTVFYDIRKVYDRMFTEEEKNMFTLMTINYRYPFPFDLETLSHFYKSSKIFVHFGDDERRCRVASYAWAGGMPVVGMACIGSLLPPELRVKPYFYLVHTYDEFDQKIVEAIQDVNNKQKTDDPDPVAEYFNPGASVKRLEDSLENTYRTREWKYENTDLFDKQLDIRLGRHHSLSSGTNRVEMTFEKFLDILSESNILEKIPLSEFDPEKKLEQMFPAKQSVNIWRDLYVKIRKICQKR